MTNIGTGGLSQLDQLFLKLQHQLGETQKTSNVDSATGTGAINGTGEAPPADATQQASIGNALASLTAFLSGASHTDVEVLLVQAAVTMRDTEASAQKSKINADEGSKKSELQAKEKKLDDAAKKMEEAEKAKHSGNIFDKIKLAFQWIGAVLAAALGAVLIATGVGAVVGGLLIAAAVTSIILAVDATVKETTGLGIAGNIAKASGASQEAIAKADMGFEIGMAVLGIVLSIAAGGANVAGAVEGAISAGTEAGEAAVEAGETAGTVVKTTLQAAKQAFSQIMDESTQAMSQSAQLARTTLEIGEAVNTAGAGATQIGSGVENARATDLQADAKSMQAEAKTNEALIQQLDDMIDVALKRLMASSDRFNSILDGITDAMQDRNDSLTKARFAG